MKFSIKTAVTAIALSATIAGSTFASTAISEDPNFDIAEYNAVVGIAVPAPGLDEVDLELVARICAHDQDAQSCSGDELKTILE